MLQGFGANDVNTLHSLLPQSLLHLLAQILSHKSGAHRHNTMQCTHLLVCKCRTALPIFQQFLALLRFDSVSPLRSRYTRQAWRLACMEASPTPICAGHIQA